MQIYHVQRLKKLAEFLEGLPIGKFNLNTWCSISTEDEQLVDQLKAKEEVVYSSYERGPQVAAKDIKCGSTACALGWAASIPEFMKQGLGLYVDGDRLNFSSSVDGEVVFITADGEKYMNYKAGEKFFGITYDEAEWLFSPDSYLEGYDDEDENDEDFEGYEDRYDDPVLSNPKVVAQRIKELLISKTRGY